MARTESKDLLTRLADAGEEALHRLADAPGADRVFGAVSSMRDRLDEMQKRVMGLEGIERRVAELERRLEKVQGGAKPASSRGAASGAKRSTSRARKTTSTSASSTAKASSARRSSGSTRKTSS